MSVSDNNKFNRYNAETKEKWGQTGAYREFSEKTKDYSEDKKNGIAKDLDGIMAEISVCMKNGYAADSSEAQCLVKALQNHITENYYNCANEILACLGQMYASDERFRKNIDRHAEGTAVFIGKAIEVYCGK